MMDSYSKYPMKNKDGQETNQFTDYYTALRDSPTAPNSSVGTIKADQTRINFDTDITVKKDRFQNFNITQIKQA